MGNNYGHRAIRNERDLAEFAMEYGKYPDREESDLLEDAEELLEPFVD